MKPLIFPFPCPVCRTSLQAEADNSGITAACPVCKSAVKIPKAPARPIDGFLIVLGVGLILGILLKVIWLIFLISVGAPAFVLVGIVLACQIALSIGFLLRRRWVRWAYPSLVTAGKSDQRAA